MAISDTETGGPGCAFPSTVWSRLTHAESGRETRARFDLGALIDIYWKPVYFHLSRSWRVSPEEAKDLVQEFFLENVLEGNLLKNFRPELGSFRAFLKGALGNFMSHEAGRRAAKKRGGHLKLISLNEGEAETAQFLPDAAALPPDQIFDAAWKKVVLDRAHSLVRDRLRQEGKDVVYEVFRLYDLESPGPEVSYKSVGMTLGLSADAVKNYLTRARELFMSAVTDVLRETVSDPASLSTELRELFGI
ncbi:MAG: sigma-70 family RNA polymerase sigma factor [Planctomycetaceae bacterium]|nr:sigma-70 family RNA polymerase sigma factor [Planctomycetaceae bacterium]